MNSESLLNSFFQDLQHTSWYEYLAVCSGILSVWYVKKENLLAYPVGLVNTIIYVFISLSGHLPGEALVNLYYTAMSIVGWYGWSRKDAHERRVLSITRSGSREWMIQLSLFIFLYVTLYFSITAFKEAYFEGAIPWADALATSSAFTGMWLMTRKKLENWYWWLITNIVSIPLYFVKHYVFTSFYYLILLMLAVSGLLEWRRKIKNVAVAN